jgi:hypothetical protein
MLFLLLPISLGVAGYTGGLDAHGVGGVHVPPLFSCRLSPSHPLAVCHLLVPLPFAIFSSPCCLPSSCPLAVCCLLIPSPFAIFLPLSLSSPSPSLSVLSPLLPCPHCCRLPVISGALVWWGCSLPCLSLIMSSCGGVIVPLSVAPLRGSWPWWVVLRHLGVMRVRSRSLPIPLLVVVAVLVVPIVMVAMMAVVVLVLVVQSFLVLLVVIILRHLVSNN